MLLGFFAAGRADGGTFDSGVQFALERLLVDPEVLLRVYYDPDTSERSESASAYRLSDLEIATRLSFFLWSSIPDEQLLDLAERRQLTRPEVLRQEVRRMLTDRRAIDGLVNDFTSQWLNLRRVDEVIVDPDRYPDFDDNLLESFKRETELFVASTIQEDRSVLDLLRANYTFVNERLARHYRIPGIYGSRFRRVDLENLNERGGLLAHGALLATTSYPDRTSPVLRGKFLMNNLFGLHVPQPPPGVDTNLAQPARGVAPASIRERLEQHRRNPSCASCHSAIDPLGFALENFDAIGGWRTTDESGKPVDASGTTMSGKKVQGLAGLRALLLERPEGFPRTLTEKLMAYALGRKIEYYDRPAIRKIVRDAAPADYRWSSIILGIIESPASAVRWYAEGFAERSGIGVTLDLPATFERLAREVETTLFRVVQEGLINIHRHAQSSTATIRLSADRERLTLEIEDRGVGMPAELVSRLIDGAGTVGVGIAGMRERLKQLGGSLEIESSHGMTLRALVPLGPQAG